ncbi:MAG: type II toxin-antitoxin system HicA family toxin [Spirochaetes bacterium]|nr:type II toxin-antitoxin system HicA family toxin [Spirochaetota bacterium]
MTDWPTTKAKRVLAALLRSGWQIRRQTGSHKILVKQGCPEYVFAFHEGVEIGPIMLKKIGKHTGLKPEDL